MARFGRQFLQQMANPTFGKGLFTAAQQIGAAPAKKRMQEQLASATPEQRFDIAIAQLTRAGELEKAARLTAARDKYVADQQVRVDGQLTNIAASQMMAAGATEVPKTITFGGKEVSIPDRLSSEILEEVNTLQSARDARELAVTSGELAPDYDAYIKANPQLLEQDPMLSKAYERVTSSEPGMLRTVKATAVKSLIKMVDDDRAARREARYGDAANEVRVQQLVDRIEARGSKTWKWQGNDMADALDDMSDSERNTFIKQAALFLKQNPNATDSEIINYGMSGMRKMIPGQEQSEAISEAEQLDAQAKEVIITTLMEKENISREEAIKRLKADQRAAALFGAGEAIGKQGMPITGGI